MKHTLQPLKTTLYSEATALVENKKVFTMKNCELNIFETYQQCTNVPLVYDGLVITSMLRGKKTIHLKEETSFSFLPGETMILPDKKNFLVDFPDASATNPVQCATLTIDTQEVKRTLDFLNENYPRNSNEGNWSLDFNRYHFHNNKELAMLLNKIIHVSMEDNLAKNALVDLTLKELLIRTIQIQNLETVKEIPNNNRFAGVVQYIHSHIKDQITIEKLCREACMSKTTLFRYFKNTFGISPVDYIIRERLICAKELLGNPGITIAEVCYNSGFNNVNYFSRLFKKTEGITPKDFQKGHS